MRAVPMPPITAAHGSPATTSISPWQGQILPRAQQERRRLAPGMFGIFQESLGFRVISIEETRFTK